MSFKNDLNDYLDFHKGERIGLISLSVILGLVLTAMVLLPHFSSREIKEGERLENELKSMLAERDSLLKVEELISAENVQRYPNKKTKSDKKKTFFFFDPNTASSAEWKKLGLNSGQVKSINNYLSKGGRFYKPKDLSKMYTISEKQFTELEPYIRIESSAKKSKYSKNSDSKSSKDSSRFNPKTKFPSENLVVHLNTCDTLDLVKLRGIGPYYARKIVEKREELGGFIAKDQLLEIWNFPEETFDLVKDQLILNREQIRFIYVNECSFDELKSHPYISYGQAKALIAYREQHGLFNDVNEITKSHLITEELCQKLKPYLKLEK